MNKKVFVSGCFDPIHEGHIAFFENAAKYGNLYVSIGSDQTIKELKNREPYHNENARLYHINSIKFVKHAFIAKGNGILDFENEIKEIKPDIFIVNLEGDRLEKRNLCKNLNIEYKVLERIPYPGLLPISSTELRQKMSRIPYRIDLAGGWLDQPFVSKYYPGSVLTISIEPTNNFNLRSGMATSTRNKAIRLWNNYIPSDNEEIAKALFGYENPPGTKEVAGSQDAIGIVMPGLNKLNYNNEEYWPRKIQSINDDEILNWIESVIFLIPLKPRENKFNVLDKINITKEDVIKLSEASRKCFDAIINKNVDEFGRYVKESFEAQIKMFPLMVNEEILKEIKKYSNLAKGWKLSGAGGGGYIILISDKEINNSIKIKIRRKN
ncbi:MAG: adenylyltransferase/cytidyltransferase family protein [Candidatus Pacearchaeota archaeon]|jgi:cytidyltransferase-like protein